MRDVPTSPCPDCGGDMMAWRHPADEDGLVWACRACGATFAFDNNYELQPLILELYFPTCPTCGTDMIAITRGEGETTWLCRTCGTTIAG